MYAVDTSTCSCAAVMVLEEDGPNVRIEKVLDIRRQLGEGRYSISERLDAVVDRLIDVLRT